MNKIECDVLIFGGGVAGLWLLDELRRRSCRALLLESRALGAGQTIASQGILHGGLKYSLGGLVDASSRAVAEMPQRWRDSLAGSAAPDLRSVRVLSPCCYMWRTDSLASRAGLMAAKVVVRTAIEKTDADSRPQALAHCPGEVLRIDEQVLDARSLLEGFLAVHRDTIVRIETGPVDFNTPAADSVQVELKLFGDSEKTRLTARHVVFAAGEGNEALRKSAGLETDIMQRRPLHMVMVRGDLPTLYGHCIDGNKTRATITSNTSADGRVVWLVGGEIAELGVALEEHALVAFAREELRSVLPGVNFKSTQWATYRINRAEGRATGNRRPEGVVWRREGAVLTAWPTKLVLAPQLAREIADTLNFPPEHPAFTLPNHWPRPDVAAPPWENAREWIS